MQRFNFVFLTLIAAVLQTQTADARPVNTNQQTTIQESYMSDLARRIKRAWFPQRDSRFEEIIFSIVVGKQGALESSKIVQSTGASEVDKKAADDAIRNASPFRPIPREISNSTFTIHFTLKDGVTVEAAK